jgi:hypothetical protein
MLRAGALPAVSTAAHSPAAGPFPPRSLPHQRAPAPASRRARAVRAAAPHAPEPAATATAAPRHPAAPHHHSTLVHLVPEPVPIRSHPPDVGMAGIVGAFLGALAGRARGLGGGLRGVWRPPTPPPPPPPPPDRAAVAAGAALLGLGRFATADADMSLLLK